nr:MAG: hypothetical protein [Bacteriophage sp.]UVY66761.1 MAG: hypothetical protein [Bacteriophage sp.]
MDRIEFKKFIQKCVIEQGCASSIVLPELAKELLLHIPCIIYISDTSEQQDSGTKYKVTNSQEEIDEIIDDINSSEMPSVVVHDKGVTLHFDHIEAEDDTVVCYLVTYDGLYTLSLSKKANSSNLIHKQN